MSAYRKSAQVDMTHGSVLGRAALFALPICAGNILQLCTARWTRWSSAILRYHSAGLGGDQLPAARNSALCLCGYRLGHLHPRVAGGRPRRPRPAAKLVRTSVWLLFAASLPLTVIGFLLGPWMLQLMQVPADAMPGAVLYLRITMLGILGNMGYNFNAGLCAA